MSSKILSKSGDSLADVYDVEGSIAGIERLETHDLPIVHEMGATVFSERFSGAIRRISSGAIAQNSSWNVVATDLPTTPARIFGVVVITADDVSDLSDVAVLVRDSGDAREIPVFAWDSNEAAVRIPMEDDGGGITNQTGLANALNVATVPSMLIGSDQPQEVNQIAFRGRTIAFGAGTITTVALIYIGFSQIGGISSRGLPIPGW